MHIGWDYLDNGTLVATYAVPVPKQIAPKLYTAPHAAKRVMLTDEEISRIYTEQTGASIDDSPWALHDFARAVIEAYDRKNQELA